LSGVKLERLMHSGMGKSFDDMVRGLGNVRKTITGPFRRRSIRLTAAIFAALLASVVARVPSARSFPWSTDMFRGPAPQPLAVAPRVMPSGTLPVNGMAPMNLEEMTVNLHNPLTPPSAADLAHGKDLFLTDCAPCHGDSGAGNGPVAHLLQHPPKNLITGVSKNLPDGYIYGYIRNGGIWMPSYGDAMNSDERWQVVAYVRSLQAAATAQNAKPAAP
jgi:mono/diheme cytochrome c family protein